MAAGEPLHSLHARHAFGRKMLQPSNIIGSTQCITCQCAAQVSASKRHPGVIRSPLVPEETRGLTRSGDISRMLPFETHLLAAGWPKWKTDEDGNHVEVEGSRAAKMLHRVRRAERNLMSYERTGEQFCMVPMRCNVSVGQGGSIYSSVLQRSMVHSRCLHLQGTHQWLHNSSWHVRA